MNDIPTFTPEEIDAVDLPEGAVLDGTDMPTPSDYLSAKQKNGIPLGADEIYKETWSWLKQRNCENLVNPRLLESYSQAFARYIQCEEAISQFGLLGKTYNWWGYCIAGTIVDLAYKEKDNPKIAVAVIVENGGYGSEAAAPIAGAVMKAALK